MAQTFFKIENEPIGLLWLAPPAGTAPEPICEKHKVAVEPVRGLMSRELFCPADDEHFRIRNPFHLHKKYITSSIKKEVIKDLEVVRIDSEGSRVIAKETVKKIKEYWIETKVSDTGSGVQIMIQVGKRNGSGEKVQLFVDSPRERLSFDENDKDLHPSGLFTKVTAEFKDSVTIIEPRKEKG